MSDQEIEHLAVIRQVLERGLKQKKAAKILEVTPRQVRRLVKKYRKERRSCWPNIYP